MLFITLKKCAATFCICTMAVKFSSNLWNKEKSKDSGDALSLMLAMQHDLLRKISGHGKSLRLMYPFSHELVSTLTKGGQLHQL